MIVERTGRRERWCRNIKAQSLEVLCIRFCASTFRMKARKNEYVQSMLDYTCVMSVCAQRRMIKEKWRVIVSMRMSSVYGIIQE